MNLAETAVLKRRAIRFFFTVLGEAGEDTAKVAERELLEVPAFFKLLFEDEFVAVPEFWAGLSLFSKALKVVDVGVAEALFDKEEWLFEVEFMEDCSVELADEMV